MAYNVSFPFPKSLTKFPERDRSICCRWAGEGFHKPVYLCTWLAGQYLDLLGVDCEYFLPSAKMIPGYLVANPSLLLRSVIYVSCWSLNGSFCNAFPPSRRCLGVSVWEFRDWKGVDTVNLPNSSTCSTSSLKLLGHFLLWKHLEEFKMIWA